MSTSKRCPAEVRERAVRLVTESRREYPNEWAAITSILHKCGSADASARTPTVQARCQLTRFSPSSCVQRRRTSARSYSSVLSRCANSPSACSAYSRAWRTISAGP